MDPRLKLTIPAHEIESEAWDQIKAILALPCLNTMAVMPDAHSGYDCPIGGVVLLHDYVSPGFVGFDQGCGMTHVNTHRQVEEICPEGMRQCIFDMLVSTIPTGFAMHGTKNLYARFGPKPFKTAGKGGLWVQRIHEKEAKQFGTLGGGNHFLEVGVNDFGEVGVTIHSGSRKPGWLVGKHYMDLAKAEGEQYGKLHLFPIKSEQGQAFLHDMAWSLNYALANRKVMMATALRVLGFSPAEVAEFIEGGDMINENHNHAEYYVWKYPEEPGGRMVAHQMVLHRKGATPAELNQYGVIPANQRDGVWITRGLGNKDFLESASHGAGRTMSRTAAKKTLDPEEFRQQMLGIVARTDLGVLDEAPGAYKDIRDVLNAQDGILVDVVDHFKPLIVLKG